MLRSTGFSAAAKHRLSSGTVTSALVSYAILSRLLYVVFVGTALRREERDERYTRRYGREAGFRRFRRAASIIMNHDAFAFILLCVLTRHTIVGSFPRPAMVPIGVTLTVIAVGVKTCPAPTLGSNAPYWPNFFDPQAAQGATPRQDRRFPGGGHGRGPNGDRDVRSRLRHSLHRPASRAGFPHRAQGIRQGGGHQSRAGPAARSRPRPASARDVLAVSVERESALLRGRDHRLCGDRRPGRPCGTAAGRRPQLHRHAATLGRRSAVPATPGHLLPHFRDDDRVE